MEIILLVLTLSLDSFVASVAYGSNKKIPVWNYAYNLSFFKIS